jgi:hypothetical protein
LQPANEAARVVVAVAILPDVVDDFFDGARGPVGRVAREGGSFLEIGEQCGLKLSRAGAVAG